MSVDNKSYIKHVKQICNEFDDKFEKDLMELYEVYTQSSSSISTERLFKIEEIINKLFYNPFRKDTLINYDFLHTPVGKVILQLLFSVGQRIYSVDEIAKAMKKSKASVHYDIDHEYLRVVKKKSIYISYESDVINYLKKKEYSQDEIKKLIQRLNES
jgi:hypothetical protein